MALIKEREPYLSRFTLESFNAYIALSERAAASALLDIQKALRPFRNERIAAATSVTDMDLRALKHRPVSIYLAPNITDITLLKPLLALFVQQTLDTLMLEHTSRSVPVYFLLDEFRQLKKMSEITTKLPYVAGYNIKMAFIIQDLKNLDEIYGETSRHSLMGNCGYQLVFGANDQVTAETVSKGLGKRTVRYKTESRTIELMGLHRRTKVEQLRERDLMMPQEVRQMPAEQDGHYGGRAGANPRGQAALLRDGAVRSIGISRGRTFPTCRRSSSCRKYQCLQQQRRMRRKARQEMRLAATGDSERPANLTSRSEARKQSLRRTRRWMLSAT